MCSFKDPGGNIFDLYQPTPEKVQEMVEKMKQEEAKAAAAGETPSDDKPDSEA